MDILHNGGISDTQFLKLCASITKGYTIYLGNFTIVPISSWWDLIRRRWHSEDRNVVLRYIDLRISKILSDLYTGTKLFDLEEISDALNGLKQFCFTYETDSNFVSELSIITNKMEHILRLEKEKQGLNLFEDPDFLPTLKTEEKGVHNLPPIKNGPLIGTLKKIRTWSEMHSQSPPQFTSLLVDKSNSFDSLILKKDNVNMSMNLN